MNLVQSNASWWHLGWVVGVFVTGARPSARRKCRFVDGGPLRRDLAQRVVDRVIAEYAWPDEGTPQCEPEIDPHGRTLCPGILLTMRNGLAFVIVGLLGCTPSGPGPADGKAPVSPTQPETTPVGEPDVDPIGTAVPEPKASAIAVHMTSATLADDCGGGPNTPPSVETKTNTKAKRDSAKGDSAKGATAMSMGKRRCEQSSIQLAITAPADAAPTKLTVKSVELLLESGELVGKLEIRAPSVWSDADGYTPWNENIEPAQELSVTYAMTQPNWSGVADRWNQTYTVKAVVSIAGADQTVEHAVVVDAPTSLPPNVKT